MKQELTRVIFFTLCRASSPPLVWETQHQSEHLDHSAHYGINWKSVHIFTAEQSVTSEYTVKDLNQTDFVLYVTFY